MKTSYPVDEILRDEGSALQFERWPQLHRKNVVFQWYEVIDKEALFSTKSAKFLNHLQQKGRNIWTHHSPNLPAKFSFTPLASVQNLILLVRRAFQARTMHGAFTKQIKWNLQCTVEEEVRSH